MSNNTLPNTIASPAQMPRPVEYQSMGDDWKAWINERKWWAQGFTADSSLDPNELKQAKANRPLIQRIVSFGGEEVCMPLNEPYLDALLVRAVFLYGDDADLQEGATLQPHIDSANYWKASRTEQGDPERIGLMTGYALSDDGVWRPHSWCIDCNSGKVIETSEPQVAYYGFLMTPDEAASLA